MYPEWKEMIIFWQPQFKSVARNKDSAGVIGDISKRSGGEC
jgi:hypothetical protein